MAREMTPERAERVAISRFEVAISMLADLPSDRARRRVLEYVRDRLQEEIEKHAAPSKDNEDLLRQA